MLAVEMEPIVDHTLLEPGSIRPISRAEYHRMLEVGILEEGEKVELLRGILVKKMTQHWPHVAAVIWLNEQLIRQLDPSYEVRPGVPFAPDIAVAKKDPNLRDHPTALLLAVDVADSSLRRDRRFKLPIYAESGVPEYWIVDVTTMTVDVYTQPSGDSYAQVQHLRDGDVLRPTQLPGVALPVAEIPR